MHKDQLRAAIAEVLPKIGMYSEEAENLLMGTAAVESQLGYYIRQIGGPARGIFQMEPATEKDIWRNYLRYKPSLQSAMMCLGYECPDPDRLLYDLKYQILMARIHYRRVPEALPDTHVAQAQYWKDHYNTKLGKGTVEKYLRSYKAYCL